MIDKCFLRNLSTNLGSTKLKAILEKEISDTKNAGTWKTERVIVGKQGPSIKVEQMSNEILNFCANNYLGLSVKYFINIILRYYQIKLRVTPVS